MTRTASTGSSCCGIRTRKPTPPPRWYAQDWKSTSRETSKAPRTPASSKSCLRRRRVESHLALGTGPEKTAISLGGLPAELIDLAFRLDRRRHDHLRLVELSDRARATHAHACPDRAHQVL